MRTGRGGAVCATAAAQKRARITAISDRSMRSPRSRIGERPGRDVEIVAHRDVHEAADIAQRPGDVALSRRVLGENQVTRPAHETPPAAGLELEDSRGEEDELAPRRVVVLLHVPFGRLAEENRAALKSLRRGPRIARHRHAAHLDRRFSRFPGEDPDDAHHAAPEPGSLKCLLSAIPWRWYEDFRPAP